MLCDLSMFILIYDKKEGRCVHYASDPAEDLLTYFNDECHREFYTNKDYQKMGGCSKDLSQDVLESKNTEDFENNEKIDGMEK